MIWNGHLCPQTSEPTSNSFLDSWMGWVCKPGAFLELDGLHHRSIGRLRPMGGVLTSFWSSLPAFKVVGTLGWFNHMFFFSFFLGPVDFCCKKFHYMYIWCIYTYKYMGAARFPGPPNLHDLQNWFKQLILQLPICICMIQHVTWEISLPSFIETVQGVRSAPHRSFTLHKVFQRLAKENKEKYWKK